MDPQELAAKIDVVIHAQKATRDDIRVVKEILTGNGDPSKGLVVRFDRVEQEMKTLEVEAKADKKFKIKVLVGAGAGLLGLCTTVAVEVIRIVWGA
jgi:hypothetical protein